MVAHRFVARSEGLLRRLKIKVGLSKDRARRHCHVLLHVKHFMRVFY